MKPRRRFATNANRIFIGRVESASIETISSVEIAQQQFGMMGKIPRVATHPRRAVRHIRLIDKAAAHHMFDFVDGTRHRYDATPRTTWPEARSCRGSTQQPSGYSRMHPQEREGEAESAPLGPCEAVTE